MTTIVTETRLAEPSSFRSDEGGKLLLEKKAKKKKSKKSSKKIRSEQASTTPPDAIASAESEFGLASGELLSKAKQDVERRKHKKSKRQSKAFVQVGGESTEQGTPRNSLPEIDLVKKVCNKQLQEDDRKLTLEEKQASLLQLIAKEGDDKDEGAGENEVDVDDNCSIHSEDSSIFSAHPTSSKRSPVPTTNRFSYERSSMLDDTDSVVGGLIGRSDESVATFDVLVKQRPADDMWNNFPADPPAMEEQPPMIPMAISAKKRQKSKKSPPSSQKRPPEPASKAPNSWDSFTQQNQAIHLEGGSDPNQDELSGISGVASAKSGFSQNQDMFSVRSESISASPSNSGSHSHRSASGRSGYTNTTKSSGESTPQIRNVQSSSPVDSTALSAFEQKATEIEWATAGADPFDNNEIDLECEWTEKEIAPSAFERKAAEMGWTLPDLSRSAPPPQARRDPIQFSIGQRALSNASSIGGESRAMADMLVSYLRSMGTSSEAAADIAARFRDQQRQQAVTASEDENFPRLSTSDRRGRGDRAHQSSRRTWRTPRAGRGVMYERAMQPGAVPMEGRAFGAPRRPDLPQTEIAEYTGDHFGPSVGADEPIPLNLVEATAVKDMPKAPVVYADSTPLSIRDLLREKSIRRRLYLLAFIVVTSVTIAVSTVVVQGKNSLKNSGVGTESPTAAPSISPTLISAETFEYAAQLSGEDILNDPTSAQFKAVGWLSTFDTLLDSFGELFEQRYALATFFYSLRGDSWLEQDQWMAPDIHECDWSDAIFCRTDGTGRRLVNGLDLTRNGLEGPLPEELQYVPLLEFLRLSKNSISGTLPRAVFSLPNLAVLDLSGNNVSGPFPSNIGEKARSLVYIDMSNNQMNGSLPIGFYSLNLLRISELSGNQFTGTIASEFGQFKVLSKLNLGSNLLTGKIPEFDKENTPLFDIIDLSDNVLTGTIPEWITGLLSRQELLVNDNFFSGTIPSVSSNAISEFLSDPTSLKNVRLKAVDLSRNQFSGTIPAWLGFFASLQYIDFSHNAFTGTLGFGEFLGARLWTGVETFRFANNFLAGTLSSALPETIKELDLRGNLFSGTVPLEISKLTRLQFVSVDDNVNLGGQVAPILQNSLYLKTFTARNTSIAGRFNGTEWTSLANIEILDLSYTSCRGTIPQEWGKLQSIKKLLLGGNELTGLIPSDLGGLTDLSELVLNDNTFVGKIPSELGLLESLEVLNLSNNNLLGKIPTELGQLQFLQSIFLSGNGLLQGSIPVGLCNVGVNFTQAALGCQIECSCCSNEPGVCDPGLTRKSSNVFHHVIRRRSHG